MVLSAAASVATAQERSLAVPPREIHLQSRVIDPAVGTPVVPGDAEFDRVHILASFASAITREQIRDLRSLGVAVLDRCPVNAHVLGVPKQLMQDGALLRSLPADTRLAPLRPTDKLSKRLLPKGASFPPVVPPYTARRGDLVEAIVLFFGDLREEGLQMRVLRQHRAQPRQRLAAINGWRVALPETEIARLAQRDPVKWVEEGPPPPRDDNDEVRGLTGVNAEVVQPGTTTPPNEYGLSGAGVVIGQWETSNAMKSHIDLAQRVMLGDTGVLPPHVRPYRYFDANSDGFFDAGEPFYHDVDGEFWVTPADVRMSSVGTLQVGPVQPGDTDVGRPLRELRYWNLPYETYVDEAPGNRLFDPGEAIYLEQDATQPGTVSAGDTRLTAVPPYAAGSVVQADHADAIAALPLRFYPAPPHGHATHVAGTMVGSGAGDATYKGVAPGASVISYHVKRLTWDEVVDELKDEHAEAVANYATISNNSWGYARFHCDPSEGGQYDVHAALNDALVSGYNADGIPALANRMLVVASAGNQSSHDCGSQSPGLWHSIQIANSTKNVLTIGNVAPSNGVEPTTLSSDSRRGPTGLRTAPLHDGRLKPDISAPGREYPLDRYEGVKSTYPPTTPAPGASYASMGGTSMAAPAVSGSAALLSEWYKRSCDLNGPKPDLLRALLVHTAHDVEKFFRIGADRKQFVDPQGFTGPDYGSGYGMIDVADAVKVMMHHRRGALSKDGLIEYPLSVGNAPELKVTLAWDDPPYSCLCAVSAQHGLLQNDLDVTLIDPAGNKHAPWQLDPGNPDDRAEPSGPIAGDISPYLDHRNTIEQVVVKDPMPGVWKISVSESKFNNVFPAQQFAVVSEFLSPARGDPAYCTGAGKTDIWLRDNASDVGTTPSGAPLYYSPDVWNRVAADGGTVHQNPVAGATNYMYATLRNDRPQPETAHAVSLELWLAPASTGLDWPHDFGLAGRLAVAQIQPGEVRTLGPIPWLVPSPQPSDHFCFYARAMTPQDPISVAETGTLGTIVASSNNLAWRNVNVVDLDTADGAPAQDIDFQVGPVNTVREERSGASHVPIDIELIVPEALLAATRIQFSLPGELDQRWRAALSSSRPVRRADAQALRPAMAADGVYPIKHPRSILFDLPLQTNERVPVRVTLQATAALGPGSYPIEIRQHQSGNIVGGIIYEATVR